MGATRPRSVRTKLIVGDVLGGVGVLPLAAAIWFGVASKPTHSSARTVFDVRPVADGAFASYGGRF